MLKGARNLLLVVIFAGLLHLLVQRFLETNEPGIFLARGFGWLFGAVLLTVLVTGIWYYFRHLVPLRKAVPGFEYAYINADGSVREVTEIEKQQLKEDMLADGPPQIGVKTQYDEKRYDGSIAGFIYRDRVPAKIEILPAEAG